MWHNKQQVYLGSYVDAVQAARAHDIMSFHLKPQNLRLNYNASEYTTLLPVISGMDCNELLMELKKYGRTVDGGDGGTGTGAGGGTSNGRRRAVALLPTPPRPPQPRIPIVLPQRPTPTTPTNTSLFFQSQAQQLEQRQKGVKRQKTTTNASTFVPVNNELLNLSLKHPQTASPVPQVPSSSLSFFTPPPLRVPTAPGHRRASVELRKQVKELPPMSPDALQAAYQAAHRFAPEVIGVSTAAVERQLREWKAMEKKKIERQSLHHSGSGGDGIESLKRKLFHGDDDGRGGGIGGGIGGVQEQGELAKEEEEG